MSKNRKWVTWRNACGSALGALLTLVGWTGEAKALQWQAHNTCWADFDVGGNWFCGLRTAQCASPGLYCKTSAGNDIGQPYPAAPASKSVSMDNFGYAWLVGNDNKIYHETAAGTWIQMSPAVPATCVKKLAISGVAGSNPRVLALACNGAIYRYLDGMWITQAASGGVDVSVTAGGTLVYFNNTNNFSFSGAGGGGIISHRVSTRPVETFTGGTFTHTVSLLGGYNAAFGKEVFFCNGGMNGVAGSAAFYSFASNRFLIGDPGGCDHLQLLWSDFDGNSSPRMIRVADGNRGPGSDRLWVLTNIGRVVSLND